MERSNLAMKFMVVLVFCSPPIAAILWKSLHLQLYVIGIGFAPLFTIMFLAISHGLMVQFGLRFKPLELFSCWIGWHWTVEAGEWDGASYHGRCEACGKSGMYDSQGNFFV